MAAVLLIVSAAAIVAGTALISWPAGLIVAGLLGLAAGIDLSRRPEPPA